MISCKINAAPATTSADIYVASLISTGSIGNGNYAKHAVLWANDVYVCGTMNNQAASWKNDKSMILSSSNSSVLAIAVK